MGWSLRELEGATCPRQRGDSPEPGHREGTDNIRDRGGYGTGPSRQTTRAEPDLSRQTEGPWGMHSPGWGGSKISSHRHWDRGSGEGWGIRALQASLDRIRGSPRREVRTRQVETGGGKSRPTGGHPPEVGDKYNNRYLNIYYIIPLKNKDLVNAIQSIVTESRSMISWRQLGGSSNPEILVVPREKTPTGAAARGNP